MKKKLTVDTIFTFGGMMFFQMVNFIMGILIARFAGISDLGAYQFFIVTTTFFGFFGKFGIDEKLTYTLPYLGGVKSKKGENFINEAILKGIIYSILAGIFTIVFYVIMSLISVEKIEVKDSYFSLIYIPMLVIGIIIGAIFRSENQIKYRALLIYLVPSIITLIIVTILILSDNINKISLILMRTLAYSAIVVLGCYLLNKIFNLDIIKSIKYNAVKTYLKSDSSLYKWLIVALLTFIIETGTLGLWLVRLTLDDYNLGIVTILLRLSMLTYIIPTAISIVFAPQIAKLRSKGEDTKSIKKKMMLFSIFAIGIVFVFLYFFGEHILFLFGKNITLFKTELIYMLIGTCFIALSQPVQSIILAAKDINKVLKSSLIAILFAVAIYFILDFTSTLTAAVKVLSISMGIFGIVKIVFLTKLK